MACTKVARTFQFGLKHHLRRKGWRAHGYEAVHLLSNGLPLHMHTNTTSRSNPYYRAQKPWPAILSTDAHTSLATEVGTPTCTGILSARVYTASTAVAKARSIQPPQRVRQVVRFGRTNAVVTMRTLPLDTSALHFPRHRARPVASSSLYVLGLVLNVMRVRWDGPAYVERC